MHLKEVAASLYAWDLADEGIESIAETLQKASEVNSLYLVGVMHHEKRPLTHLFYPHNRRRKYYVPENSRAYFRLDANRFKSTKLKPLFSERDFLKETDWLDVLSKEARRRNLKAGVELSHTLYDTQIARRDFPEMMQKTVHGRDVNEEQGMLCPNHPDVREFLRHMFCETARGHDIDFIQTCLMTFSEGGAGRDDVKPPWFFDEWLTPKDASIKSLLSVCRGGCFCPSCANKAKGMGYDWDEIIHDLKALSQIAEATPYKHQEKLMETYLTLGSNLTDSMLLIEFPGLLQFIQFRIDCITELFRDIRQSLKQVAPAVELRYNNFIKLPEYAGISYRHIAPFIDSVRDSDYSEQTGAKDGFLYKRQTLLKLRRGIGFDKDLIAAVATRPMATPELIRESIWVMREMGIDGLSLGHYDGARQEHLEAVGQGIREAGFSVDS